MLTLLIRNPLLLNQVILGELLSAFADPSTSVYFQCFKNRQLLRINTRIGCSTSGYSLYTLDHGPIFSAMFDISEKKKNHRPTKAYGRQRLFVRCEATAVDILAGMQVLQCLFLDSCDFAVHQ